MASPIVGRAPSPRSPRRRRLRVSPSVCRVGTSSPAVAASGTSRGSPRAWTRSPRWRVARSPARRARRVVVASVVAGSPVGAAAAVAAALGSRARRVEGWLLPLLEGSLYGAASHPSTRRYASALIEGSFSWTGARRVEGWLLPLLEGSLYGAASHPSTLLAISG